MYICKLHWNFRCWYWLHEFDLFCSFSDIIDLQEGFFEKRRKEKRLEREKEEVEKYKELPIEHITSDKPLEFPHDNVIIKCSNDLIVGTIIDSLDNEHIENVTISLDFPSSFSSSEVNLLMIYICNFHVLSLLLLIYICKIHWNLNTMFMYVR